MLPFTHNQFLDVFRDYNLAIWPAQFVAYGFGFAVLVLLLCPSAASGRTTLAVLALMWLWTAIAYHGFFFSRINDAALVFSSMFVLEGLMLLWAAWAGRPGKFRIPYSATGWVGLALCVYALFLYPLIGMLAGHAYPAVPVFGVTPCPVVIFTLGMLLLADDPVPIVLVVVPGLWSLIGGSAAFLLHVPQDWMLLLSGFLAIPLIIHRARYVHESPS